MCLPLRQQPVTLLTFGISLLCSLTDNYGTDCLQEDPRIFLYRDATR